MSGSWLNAKEVGHKSDDFPTTEPNPTPAHGESRKGPRHSLAGRLSTPHDAFFMERAEKSIDGNSQAHYRSPNMSSVFIAPGLDTLVDPFDGSVLGKMTLPDPNFTTEPIPMGAEINQNEELWSHLSRVLELQSDIAKLHMGMEGIGGEGKSKGKVTPNLGKNRDAMESRHKVTRLSSTLDDLEHVGEGVEVGPKDGEEEGQNKEREEEFARLADQFEGRKEGINEIMLKLDDLSQALTEFHALQEPKPNVNFSPRQNSVPIGSVTSSPTISTDHARSTFTPMPPFTPIFPTIPTLKTDNILGPSRLVDSPVSTVESAFARH